MTQKTSTLFIPSLLVASLLLTLPSNSLATGETVVINEIMYNPVGTDTNHEWIELYNVTNDAVNMTGWKLFEENTNHGLSAVQGSLTVPGQGFAVLTGSGSVFLSDHPGFSGTVLDTTFSLSNTGEGLSLKDNKGNVVNATSYQSAAGANGNGKTLEKGTDGNFVESELAGGTPGLKNSAIHEVVNQNENSTTNGGSGSGSIVNGNANLQINSNSSNENTNLNSDPGNANVNNNEGSGGSNANSNQAPGNLNLNQNNTVNENTNSSNENGNTNMNSHNSNQNQSVALAPGSILINEFLAAPDTDEQEWIELYNASNDNIDLSQLSIEDLTAHPKKLTGLLAAHSYLVLEPAPVSLNNSGDQITLKDQSGIIIDQVRYGNLEGQSETASAPGKGKSVGRFPNGMSSGNNQHDFRAFGVPTKGAENLVNNRHPYAVISLQSPYKRSGDIPFSVNLTGDYSFDYDQDDLTYFWDFDDGTYDTKSNPASHKYYTVGTYEIRLTVTDPFGGTDTATLTVTALPKSSGTAKTVAKKEALLQSLNCSSQETSDKIMLSEILPNPDGSDGKDEFIEIENIGDVAVSLCGWQLDDLEGAGSKPYQIHTDLVLPPHSYRTFFITETGLSLNNTEDDVRLLDGAGKLIDKVHYEHAEQGKSYSRLTKS